MPATSPRIPVLSCSAVNGTIPITVGITGHRDIDGEDVPRISAAIREILVELRQAFPHSPLVFLSPLAEGADRLAALAALEQGAELIVPLPMPEELYCQDFNSSQSRQEFQELLARSRHSFVVPEAGKILDGSTGPSTDGERDRLYALVGAWLVNHCHLLLAVWDGRDDRGEGGTAQVVEWKLVKVPESYLPGFDPLLPGEASPVIHIRARRSGEKEMVPTLGDWRWIAPLDWDGLHEKKDFRHHLDSSSWEMKEIDDPTLRQIESFNRKAANVQPRKAHANPLFPAEKPPPGLEPLHQCFLNADALADLHQRKTRIVLHLLLILVAAAAYCYEWFAGINASNSGMVLGFLVLFALAFAVHSQASRSRWTESYLEYRSLAEGLRVQIFWSLARLAPCAADHYMRAQRDEIGWVRRALKAITLLGLGASRGQSEAQVRSDLSQVSDLWLLDQATFFRARARKLDACDKRYSQVSRLLFLAAILLGVIYFFLLHFHHSTIPDGANWPNFFFFSIGSLLLLSGLIHVYVEKSGFTGLANRYLAMAELFELARHRMEDFLRHGDLEAARKLLFELGRDALSEHGDWLLFQRERPLEVPG